MPVSVHVIGERTVNLNQGALSVFYSVMKNYARVNRVSYSISEFVQIILVISIHLCLTESTDIDEFRNI